MNQMLNQVTNFFTNYGWKIIIVICVLIIGGILIHYIAKGLKLLLYRTRLDPAIVAFATSLFKIIIWIGLIFVCAGLLNLSTSSLLVCLSSVALAVGLALKDSLTNLTNGIMIIYNKTFKRGDHVSVNGIEGIIQNIKLFSIELTSFDNKKLIIPNSKFTTDIVINYSALPTRRLDLTYSVAYGTDLKLVEKTIKNVLKSEEKILLHPEFDIFLSTHNSSSLDFTVRFWVNTEDYFTINKKMPGLIYEAFTKANISIPFNQLDVHIDTINEKEAK